jgi:esterase/lipase
LWEVKTGHTIINQTIKYATKQKKTLMENEETFKNEIENLENKVTTEIDILNDIKHNKGIKNKNEWKLMI